MQMFMDSPDWLKGIVPEDMGRTYTSSSPSSCDHLISCSKPPALEKRLRPPHDQALKCPRCESTHTKFCYYNNYSLSQPRYFCKTCRRYWTKGGTLRNVPVGGGCRKNKRSSAAAKKAPDHLLHSPLLSEATSSLRQPCFPLVQLPPHVDFMECKYNDNILLLENSADCLHLMDAKLSAGIGEPSHGFGSAGLHDVNSTGFTIDGNHCALMDACQRLALPFEGHKGTDLNAVEVKPGQNERLLSMEWPAANVGSEAIAFSNHGLGLWAGLMNGHGSSAV